MIEIVKVLGFPTDLLGFIQWAGGTGLAIVAGVIVSLGLERISWFKNWQSPHKGLVVIALFIVLPIFFDFAASMLARLDEQTVAVIQHYLLLALSGLIAWGSSQYSHAKDPEKKKDSGG